MKTSPAPSALQICFASPERLHGQGRVPRSRSTTTATRRERRRGVRRPAADRLPAGAGGPVRPGAAAGTTGGGAIDDVLRPEGLGRPAHTADSSAGPARPSCAAAPAAAREARDVEPGEQRVALAATRRSSPARRAARARRAPARSRTAARRAQRHSSAAASACAGGAAVSPSWASATPATWCRSGSSSASVGQLVEQRERALVRLLGTSVEQRGLREQRLDERRVDLDPQRLEARERVLEQLDGLAGACRRGVQAPEQRGRRTRRRARPRSRARPAARGAAAARPPPGDPGPRAARRRCSPRTRSKSTSPARMLASPLSR